MQHVLVFSFGLLCGYVWTQRSVLRAFFGLWWVVLVGGYLLVCAFGGVALLYAAGWLDVAV